MRAFVLSAVLLGLAGPAEARLRVSATVPALAALAREVGGEHVEVRSLTRRSQDPHFVDARPSLALDLNRTDLLLLVGLDLEVGWLPTLLTGARNKEILPGARGYLDCSQFVPLREVRSEPIDRSHGDIHPGGNPHFLTDPRAAALVARGIAGRLADLDPPRRAAYERNLAAFLARLEAARQGWEARLVPVRGSAVIGYHRTWVYLADWVGLVEVDFLEPKPGIPPNPAHVARLLGRARARGVRAILQEEYYPEATSRLVAQKIPAQLVRVPGGPDFQAGQSYIAWMEQVVQLLERGLRPRGGA